MAVLLGGILVLPAVSQKASPEVLEYVRAIRVQRGRISYTVDVTISASIPSMSKSGIMQAVKKQDPGGHPEYKPVSFDGDKIIKTDVIARYLQAELEIGRAHV